MSFYIRVHRKIDNKLGAQSSSRDTAAAKAIVARVGTGNDAPLM
jgi:hypothetical protein